jgi:hypothetical protein
MATENEVITANVAVTNATWSQNLTDLRGLFSSSLVIRCALRQAYRDIGLGAVPELEGALSCFIFSPGSSPLNTCTGRVQHQEQGVNRHPPAVIACMFRDCS